METFNSRLRKLIDSSNSRNDKEFARTIGERVENISRIASGKVPNPRITFLRKVAEGRQLNPRELYHLLIGKPWKDPTDILETENQFLREEISRKDREIDQLKRWIDQLISQAGNNTPAPRRQRAFHDVVMIDNPADDSLIAEIIADSQSTASYIGNK